MDEVFPYVDFYILGIPVRNTVVSTWVTMVLIIGLVWLLRRKLPTLLVMVIDFLRSTITDVLEGQSADPYIPFLGTQLIFLLVANNIGILPLVVTPTIDINTPVAAAVLVFFAVHYFGVREKGVLGYLKEQASPMVVLEIIVAVIYRLVGPIVPLPMIGLGLVTGVLQAYIFLVLSTGAIASAVRHRAVA
jgi:F-type H+-transporting ATPase subunit a